MGQEVRGVPEAAALTEAAERESESGVGSFLARQRRLRGISLDELCARTRIPRRSLERLEAGAFDAAPDGFTRGFVRTVAGALGLDADDAVARLLAEPADEEAGDRGARRLRRSLALAGALVVAAAGAVLAVWLLRAALESANDPAGPELLYRRDAVRALAETVGPPADPGDETPQGPERSGGAQSEPAGAEGRAAGERGRVKP